MKKISSVVLSGQLVVAIQTNVYAPGSSLDTDSTSSTSSYGSVTTPHKTDAGAVTPLTKAVPHTHGGLQLPPIINTKSRGHVGPVTIIDGDSRESYNLSSQEPRGPRHQRKGGHQSLGNGDPDWRTIEMESDKKYNDGPGLQPSTPPRKSAWGLDSEESNPEPPSHTPGSSRGDNEPMPVIDLSIETPLSNGAAVFTGNGKQPVTPPKKLSPIGRIQFESGLDPLASRSTLPRGKASMHEIKKAVPAAKNLSDAQPIQVKKTGRPSKSASRLMEAIAFDDASQPGASKIKKGKKGLEIRDIVQRNREEGGTGETAPESWTGNSGRRLSVSQRAMPPLDEDPLTDAEH